VSSPALTVLVQAHMASGRSFPFLLNIILSPPPPFSYRPLSLHNLLHSLLRLLIIPTFSFASLSLRILLFFLLSSSHSSFPYCPSTQYHPPLHFSFISLSNFFPSPPHPLFFSFYSVIPSPFFLLRLQHQLLHFPHSSSCFFFTFIPCSSFLPYLLLFFILVLFDLLLFTYLFPLPSSLYISYYVPTSLLSPIRVFFLLFINSSFPSDFSLLFPNPFRI
jgi:hypothetical protein